MLFIVDVGNLNTEYGPVISERPWWLDGVEDVCFMWAFFAFAYPLPSWRYFAALLTAWAWSRRTEVRA